MLRPGYYLGIDTRKKLVILGIRGTQIVYDLITDIVSSIHEGTTFEGYRTHFGTAEAARWFLPHEIDPIRRCLKDHKGFRLRIVGHFPGRITAFKNEDWKGVIDLVTNTKHVASSIQDVAQKLAEYAKFREQRKYSEMPMKEEVSVVPSHSRTSSPSSISSGHVEHENSACGTATDFFVPGTLYYLKKNTGAENCLKPGDYFTLLRRHRGEHFQRILISSNIISDHKCDSHYYALRDVLKGLPTSLNNDIFDE
ncbi:hypothetical protein Salat_2250200 [Sesamum alatum]|uniref:Fungal lipase-type domain-containing protein n=1 Tax=Sesamum alatum TaxID=300844 RepID=A0AAE1XUU5_9LAMI|nr:hypothetical protein Salat_2250200 [Sesamum alatum]